MLSLFSELQHLIVCYVSGVCKDVYVSTWVQCDYGEQQNKTPHQCEYPQLLLNLEIVHRFGSVKQLDGSMRLW